MANRVSTSRRRASEDDDAYSIALWRKDQQDQDSVVRVPISSLLTPDSPRLAGENIDHSRALAESEAMFPPIIVNRSTMRVIDGMHRLRAAVLRGHDEIEVKFFDGDQGDAFVLAVEMNITHGLPLSLADRTAAAARIIKSHPQWSDRLIASSTGLAAKTVGAIRQRSSGENPQLNARVGRDHRVRPLNTAEGRKIAGELMRDKPDAPLREIARRAGISLGTAQNVHKRLRHGENSVLPRQHAGDQQKSQPGHHGPPSGRDSQIFSRTPVGDQAAILKNLSRDPSLRSAEAGRALLRLLHVLTFDTREWEQFIGTVPAHCAVTVSAAARACAQAWQEFAEQLERR